MYWVGGIKENGQWKWNTGNIEFSTYENWAEDKASPHNGSYLQLYRATKDGHISGTWQGQNNIGDNNIKENKYWLKNCGYICEWDYKGNDFEYIAAKDFISGSTLKTFSLKDDLERYGVTNSDNDTLPDSKEVNWELMDEDGSLPSIRKLIYERHDGYVESGKTQLENLLSQFGTDNIARERFLDKEILPLLSDPLNEDGDGDGIGDDIDPEKLKINTIETMFKLSSKNNINNPIYMTINKNDVEVTAHVRFIGDANDVYANSNDTCATILADAIEDFWDVSINGNKYDFLPGIKGNFKVNVIYEVPEGSYFTSPEQKYLYIKVDNENPDLWDVVSKYVSGSGGHVSNLDGKYTYEKWSMKNQSLVTMYSMYQYRNGSTDIYDENTYRLVVAHEFGHILGMADAYFRDKSGNYYAPVTSEVPNDDIMRQGVWPYSVQMNDVEMVLQAFQDNKFQYFYDMSSERKKSSVIRES